MRRRGWSARRWSIEAKLGDTSHLSGLMRKMRRDGPDIIVGGLDTWAALAEAAGVSLDWLVHGRGDPWGAVGGQLDFPIPTDRYPTRALALAVGHLFRFSEATLAEVAAIDDFDRDPGAEYWLIEMSQRQLLREKRRRSSSRPPDAG